MMEMTQVQIYSEGLAKSGNESNLQVPCFNKNGQDALQRGLPVT